MSIAVKKRIYPTRARVSHQSTDKLRHVSHVTSKSQKVKSRKKKYTLNILIRKLPLCFHIQSDSPSLGVLPLHGFSNLTLSFGYAVISNFCVVVARVVFFCGGLLVYPALSVREALINKIGMALCYPGLLHLSTTAPYATQQVKRRLGCHTR